MGRACRWANEVDVAPAHGLLNGSGRYWDMYANVTIAPPKYPYRYGGMPEVAFTCGDRCSWNTGDVAHGNGGDGGDGGDGSNAAGTTETKGAGAVGVDGGHGVAGAGAGAGYRSSYVSNFTIDTPVPPGTASLLRRAYYAALTLMDAQVRGCVAWRGPWRGVGRGPWAVPASPRPRTARPAAVLLAPARPRVAETCAHAETAALLCGRGEARLPTLCARASAAGCARTGMHTAASLTCTRTVTSDPPPHTHTPWPRWGASSPNWTRSACGSRQLWSCTATTAGGSAKATSGTR